jgi:DNA-binding transcriptional regulator YdaS (Cro superfamily)
MTTALEALQRAIDLAGGQNALARKINETGLGGDTFYRQGHVSYWLKSGKAGIPACRAIEKATGVTCNELRPDVFRSEAA